MSKTIRKHKNLKHAKITRSIREVSSGEYIDISTSDYREFDERGDNKCNYRRKFFNDLKKDAKGKIKTKEKQLIKQKLKDYYDENI